ncbi:MAG: hypothetical protein RLZZ453_397 [Chlamydiota bacterium]|jgi:hypothetical protein
MHKSILFSLLLTSVVLHADQSEEQNHRVFSYVAPFGGTLAVTKSETTSTKSADTTETNMITPPVLPTVKTGADVFVTADFIYWKAESDGLDYAYTGGVPGGGFNSQVNASNGHLKSPTFTYEPGFKAGLGVLANHDGWDFYAEYTWLSVASADTESVLLGDLTNPVQGTNSWGYLGISPICTQASASWQLRFNALDFELGRNFWVSKRLTLRPHTGFKFSWLQQEYSILSSNLIISGDVTTGALTQSFELKQFGIGIRSGLDTAYYLWNKWAIFSDFAITGMWNSFDTSRKDLYQVFPGDALYTNVNVHQKPHTISSILEIDIGLRFETVFGKGGYKYMLQAGWETQVWFSQEKLIRFNTHTADDLTFEGLTIKTGFWF